MMAKQSIPPDLAWRLLWQIVGVNMLRTVIGTIGSGRASNKDAVARGAGRGTRGWPRKLGCGLNCSGKERRIGLC